MESVPLSSVINKIIEKDLGRDTLLVKLQAYSLQCYNSQGFLKYVAYFLGTHFYNEHL